MFLSFVSEFFDQFNAALPEFASEFTEDWILGSSNFPAIAIDKLTVGSKIMSGGQLIDATVEIYVDLDTFNASGVKKGNLVTARGTQLSVLRVDSDGDDSRTLVCGPAGIEVWGVRAQDVPIG